MKNKKILFIQHAANFGGSVMSLLYTLNGLREQNPNNNYIILLTKYNPEIIKFYKSYNFDVIFYKPLYSYEHTQALYYNLLNPISIFNEIFQIIKLFKNNKRIRNIIKIYEPDIVHLNSVVLFPLALIIKKFNIPLIWHIRESPYIGLIGVRFRIIKYYILKLPNSAIFICNSDFVSWGSPSNGIVVYNFVDFSKFNKEFKIESKEFKILFLGGYSKIKGGIILIKAINEIYNKYPNIEFKVLLPGFIVDKPKSYFYKFFYYLLPIIGSGTNMQLINREILKSSKPNSFVKLKYEFEVQNLFAQSSILVFPSIRPHFARPIIEAGAMGIPVIGSNLNGVKELIVENETGLLFNSGSFKELSEKILILFNSRQNFTTMGNSSYKCALEKYDQHKNIRQILNLYEKI